MAISIGDVTFNFLANTTELDLAFTRIVEEAQASSAAAAAGLSPMAGSFDAVTAAVANSRTDIDDWNETIMAAIPATEKVTASTHGMTEQLKVGEEMFGVRLPRGINRFLAELPGLGTAIQAAFAAGVVFFLVEAIVKGTEKLTDFISNTFIFTQAMKDSDAAVKKQNVTLVELAAQIEKDSKALEDFGKTQEQLKSDSITHLTEQIKKNELAFAAAVKTATAYATAVKTSKPEEAADELGKLNGVLGAIAGAFAKVAVAEKDFFGSIKAFFTGGPTPAEVAAEAEKAGRAAQEAAINTSKLLADERLKLSTAQLEFRKAEDDARKEELGKLAAHNQAQIQAAQTLGSSLLTVQKAQAEALLAFDGSQNGTRLLIEKTFGEAEYQLTLETHKKKLAATQQAENQLYQMTKSSLDYQYAMELTMGEAGVKSAQETQVRIEQLTKTHDLQLKTEAIKGNGEIQALENQHHAKLISDDKKFADEYLKIEAEVFNPKNNRGLGAGLGQDIDQFQKLADAAAKLGVTLESSLVKSSADAKKAVDVMSQGYKANKITLDDLNRSKLAYVKTLIAEGQAEGKDVTALKNEERELVKLIPKVKEATKVHADLREMIKSTDVDFNNFVFAMAAGSESMAQSAKKLAEALISTLEKYAEKKGAEALAEGFTQLAMHDPSASISFHAAGLWFALAAAGAAAGGAMSGSGSGSSGAGSSSPAMTTGSNVQPATNPAQGPNVPHLAAGGLITGPTLAMLGESNGREAVLPLNDGNAMNMIAEAISKHLSQAGGGGTNFYIRGMVSSDTVGKMAKKLTRQVQTGRTRLTASNTHKITRRA